MNEHDPEPIRGLPQRPPPGESILWQGEPRWTALAVRAFHVRKVALYFALLLAWRVGTALAAGLTPLDSAAAALPLLVLALLALAVLALLAWGSSRTTVYTITNRRVVLRIGIALPITINVPFGSIESAAVRVFADGTGDIPLALRGTGRVGYIPLWPHARPWRLGRPEPMLRTVPDAVHVAALLTAALSGADAGRDSGASTMQRPQRDPLEQAEARAARAEAWPEVVS